LTQNWFPIDGPEQQALRLLKQLKRSILVNGCFEAKYFLTKMKATVAGLGVDQMGGGERSESG